MRFHNHHMKPLSDIDTQETLSFLPDAPVVHIEIPKRKAKSKRCCSCLYNCRPWVVKSLIFLFVFACVLGVKFYLITSRANGHNIKKISRWGTMSLKSIDHWCLQPNVTTCKCANPLQPTPRHGHKTWTEAHQENIQIAKNHHPSSDKMFRETDVVFLGDSIIEGWIGRSLGQQKERKQKNIKVFEELFDMDKGGDFDGIALGISGDKSQNLLWRLKHGEMPKSLKSKVYWVLIGTNDFLYAEAEQCSEEVILMGIQRVVEEMMILRPSATIVVNGLLPRSDIGRGTDGRLYEKDEKTVMDAIDIVNEKLKAYCDLHDDLEYFDPSGLFEDENPKLGKGKFAKYIPKDLMKDALHPTALGYKKWGQKIVEKLRSVLDVKLDVE